MTPICGLTWAAVRERSTSKLGSLNLHCGDCDVQFHYGGTPCIKHTLPEEQGAREARVCELIARVEAAVSEVLYSQPLYAVLIDGELYAFSAGTTREQAEEWIAQARARVAEEEQVN